MAKFRGKRFYLGAWSYVFLDILYMIPVVGFICLLVHSFSSDEKDENRRHYARSYFARMLLFLIIGLIGAAIIYFTIGFDQSLKEIKNLFPQINTGGGNAGV